MDFFSRSPEQTRRVGMKLGALLQKGDLLCLSGDLGAGKTTFIQGIARGWGSLDNVTSPTFVLVNVYRRSDGQNLYHMDAYRIQDALEAEDLDMENMLENGALIIEWAERIQGALPPECMWIKMRYVADEQRGLVVNAKGERSDQLLAQFRRRVFGG